MRPQQTAWPVSLSCSRTRRRNRDNVTPRGGGGHPQCRIFFSDLITWPRQKDSVPASPRPNLVAYANRLQPEKTQKILGPNPNVHQGETCLDVKSQWSDASYKKSNPANVRPTSKRHACAQMTVSPSPMLPKCRQHGLTYLSTGWTAHQGSSNFVARPPRTCSAHRFQRAWVGWQQNSSKLRHLFSMFLSKV
jgi:hypothetical protein